MEPVEIRYETLNRIEQFEIVYIYLNSSFSFSFNFVLFSNTEKQTVLEEEGLEGV